MRPMRWSSVHFLSNLGILLCFTCQAPAIAEEAEPTPVAVEGVDSEGIRFFETRIRPLLAARCYDCHREDLQESGLRLDTWKAIQSGGGSGRAIVPGQPDRSLLIAAVRYQDLSLQMPPDEKLTDREISDLEKWIASGAPHPDNDGSEAGPSVAIDRGGDDFWSFQSLRHVELPAIEFSEWVQSPIDVFILKKLEEVGLGPNPATDKTTLIRRATYDLIGLPPTPEEIADFLGDDTPDAYERLVDRLLASPQYGERWGRHWLDVARYADSNGLDENVAHGNAWRYRDWVVGAWNRDIPYDQFVRDQIAGDLYPTDEPQVRHERLTATGFLSLGPKVLAEVDKTKMEMDIIDEQLDTLGRSFLGLTFGCARCHDHKFDPISADDYYGLAGIFKSTQTMETFKTIARWYEHEVATPEELALKEAHEAKIVEQKKRVDQTVAEATQQLKESLGEGAALPEKPEDHFSDEVKAKLQELRNQVTELEKSRPEMSSAMGVTEGEVTDLPVHLRGSHLSLGEVVSRRFPTVLTRAELPTSMVTVPADASGRRELAEWMTDPEHPLTARVMVNRLWRWHFGQGIVDSPDNFGKLGVPASHPDLLDWLAREFSRQGWSMKKMHRIIMLSSTYQMSSQPHEEGRQVDPENRLLWRAPLRRLEAEALRDGLLVASGRLDNRMGGSMLHVKNYAFFFDHTSKDTTSYDSDRRSLYLPIVRNNMYDGFQLFDYTDSSVLMGDRETTTVPTQALFMMNSELLEKGAQSLAERLMREADTDEERIQLLYLRVVGRNATEFEIVDARDSLEQLEALLADHSPPGCSDDLLDEEGEPRPVTAPAHRSVLAAWQVLCHALLASNEFVYLR